MPRRTTLIVAAAVSLSVLLTLLKIPLASSQGLTLRAAYVPGELSTQILEAALWSEAVSVDIPLSAQQAAVPRLLGGEIQSVTAKAVHNNSQLALLLSWKDDTEDTQMIGAQDFQDAAAVQFPLVEGIPFFCMGQVGGNVNIWHWKGGWQADLVDRLDMEDIYPNMQVDYYPFTETGLGALTAPDDYSDPNYLTALAAGNPFASLSRSSPIEDLVAGGFGTMTSQPIEEQNVQGTGAWEDGRWRVMFLRDLASPQAYDVNLRPGQVYSFAVAVWDGSVEQRDGLKSTSQWASLQIEAGPIAPVQEVQAARAEGDQEALIFCVAPMVAVLAAILLLAGGFTLVGSIVERRR